MTEPTPKDKIMAALKATGAMLQEDAMIDFELAVERALSDTALAEFVNKRTTFVLVDAIRGLLPILEGVRFSVGLGKTQLARIEAAKNAIAPYAVTP